MGKPDRILFRAFLTIFLSVVFAVSAIVFLSDIAETGADAVTGSGFSHGEILVTSYTEDLSGSTNPERGWYRSYFTDDLTGIDRLFSQGISVIQLKADLGDFIDREISEGKLKEIDKAFRTARRFGLMVIFRAAYDFSGKTAPEPDKLSLITGHIEQLGRIFSDHNSILMAVQAGFLGPWGEWHSSYYGDIPSYEARRTVIEALLRTVPASGTIQVRRPVFIRDLLEDDTLTTEETSRIGFHNDALLSSDNDYGTYTDASLSREDELAWLDSEIRDIPFAGETISACEYNDPSETVENLDKLNADTINIDYHPEVINKWKSTEYKGGSTFKYLSDNLGYRFVLKESRIVSVVRPGENIGIEVELLNSGLGQLQPGRNLEIILKNGKTEYVSSTGIDPAEWNRESGRISLKLEIEVPSDAGTGNWSLYLNLPSRFEELRDDPSYSVRFANEDTWEETTGYNMLTDRIIITSSDQQ